MHTLPEPHHTTPHAVDDVPDNKNGSKIIVVGHSTGIGAKHFVSL